MTQTLTYIYTGISIVSIALVVIAYVIKYRQRNISL
jgi:hypothetical protein